MSSPLLCPNSIDYFCAPNMGNSHGNMTFLMHIQRCALALLKITMTTLYKFLYILLLSFNNIWLYDNYGKLKESQWKSYGLCLLIILSIKEFGLPVIVIVIMLGRRWRMWRVRRRRGSLGSIIIGLLWDEYPFKGRWDQWSNRFETKDQWMWRGGSF